MKNVKCEFYGKQMMVMVIPFLTGAGIDYFVPGCWAKNSEVVGGNGMAEFTINEMKEMQKILQDKYKDKWEGISPEVGKNKLLWLIGEIGEVIDIVKKHGGLEASQDADLKQALIEELADVLMYYNDILLCYDISSDELKSVYIDKFKKNMNRW